MFGIWSFLRQFMYTKFIVVVDDDVDVRDWKEVDLGDHHARRPGARHAASSRTRRSTTSTSPRPVGGLGCKMGIDATNKWPGETSREWGRPIAMDAAVRDKVDAMWRELGL